LKACEAFVPGSYVEKCGKLFVAERSTKDYCSDTCKYRMFKRSGRKAVAKARREATSKKLRIVV